MLVFCTYVKLISSWCSTCFQTYIPSNTAIPLVKEIILLLESLREFNLDQKDVEFQTIQSYQRFKIRIKVCLCFCTADDTKF